MTPPTESSQSGLRSSWGAERDMRAAAILAIELIQTERGWFSARWHKGAIEVQSARQKPPCKKGEHYFVELRQGPTSLVIYGRLRRARCCHCGMQRNFTAGD